MQYRYPVLVAAAVCIVVVIAAVSLNSLRFVLFHGAYDARWVERKAALAIPPVCHQTWKSKTEFPASVAKAMRITREANPGLEFRLYDNRDMEEYIRRHFPARVSRCYHAISPDYMAARADLFRYCVMYHEGGIYLDIKSVIYKDIFGFIRPGDAAIMDRVRHLEGYRREVGLGTWEQWLLIFAPHHDYMRRAISRICDSIDESCRDARTFTGPVFDRLRNPDTTGSKETVLRLTGPDGLANAIHSSILASGIQHRTIPYNYFASIIHSWLDDPRPEMSRQSRHYSQAASPLVLCKAH